MYKKIEPVSRENLYIYLVETQVPVFMDMLKDKFVKRVLFLIALAVLVWLLWALRSIFVYMAIASVLGLMASPAVNFLERLHFGRFHIPNVVNVLLVMVLMIVVDMVGGLFDTIKSVFGL